MEGTLELTPFSRRSSDENEKKRGEKKRHVDGRSSRRSRGRARGPLLLDVRDLLHRQGGPGGALQERLPPVRSFEMRCFEREEAAAEERDE